jgi:hypothetical protein
MDGTIQIGKRTSTCWNKELTNFSAALDCCVRGPPDQSKSIDAVASIATLLMQKYTKSNGAKGIDNVDRWSMDSLAFQFLLKTDTAESVDELKEVCSDQTLDRQRSI